MYHNELFGLRLGKMRKGAKETQKQLDGQRRETARRIGRRLHIDTSTVHRHNRRVMEDLLVYVFGIYGVFQDKTNGRKCEP